MAQNDPSVKTLKPVSVFLRKYESETGQIVVSDHEELDNWFVNTFADKWWEHEGDDFREWLQSKGVGFKKADRNVKLWRVQDSDNYRVDAANTIAKKLN